MHSGSVAITAQSEMWGFEANLAYHCGNDRLRADALIGFRYLQLSESLQITDPQITPLRPNTLTFLGAFVNAPNAIADTDQFLTRNQFYGGQIGGTVRWEDWWYFVRLTGKVGFGCTQQQVTIDGSSTLITPAGNTTVPGGILAQPTNIGTYRQNVFGIVPEWGVTAGVFVTDWLRITGGYSFLFWNRVIRPGDAIDRSINPGQVPTASGFGVVVGPPRPQFSFNDSSFWVQFAQAGIELVY